MRITVLSRGGLSVYGGDYNPKTNEAEFQIRDGETVPVTIEYPSAPSSPSKSTSGITSTTPAASGNTVTCTLSSINDNGYADISATVGGVTKKVRIRARTDVETDQYSS